MELMFLLLAFVGGAVFWHFTHTKIALAVASFESRVSALEQKAKQII